MDRDRVGNGIGRRAACGLLLAALSVTFGTGAAVLVHRGGGVTRAAASPIALLGTTARDAGCVAAPLEVGSGTSLFCGDYSAVAVEGTIRVVSLYAPGDSVVDAYEGPLPVDVAWGTPLREVEAALGEPSRITDMYGPPTLVYRFDGGERYHSLELQFDEYDELVRINASLLH